jgi:hypothetical protein
MTSKGRPAAVSPPKGPRVGQKKTGEGSDAAGDDGRVTASTGNTGVVAATGGDGVPTGVATGADGIPANAVTGVQVGAGTATAVEYRVMPAYNRNFETNSEPVTITDLLDETLEDPNSTLCWSEMEEEGGSEPAQQKLRFMFAVMLKLSRPDDKKTDQGFVGYKGTKFGKKAKIEKGSYKKSMLFGDLNDPEGKTFVIFEETNDKHALLFRRDRSIKDVRVGARLAVMEPRIDGRLKSGSYIVITEHPFEFLSGPDYPPRGLRTEQVGHDLRFFVKHGEKLMWRPSDRVSVLRTLCNGEACDRLQSNKNPNDLCGCWHQASRSDSTAKNTVLKFDFYMKDGYGKSVQVKDFVSLRTSRLFFEDRNIRSDQDALFDTAVDVMLQRKWLATVKHVNRNGGWTIVGWFMRANVVDESAEENEGHIETGNVKINISYLYPTNTDLAVPLCCSMRQAEIRATLGLGGLGE